MWTCSKILDVKFVVFYQGINNLTKQKNPVRTGIDLIKGL